MNFEGSTGFRFGFGPDSVRLNLFPAKIDRVHTASERHRMIAEAAYLIAERRGFAGGHELSDWLAAEREVNRTFGSLSPWLQWDY
jgi:hypothetical protein